MKQLIPLALLYFIYDFISVLVRAERPFTVVHYIMMVMIGIFIVLVYFTGKDALKDAKAKKAEQEESAAKAKAEAEAKRRSMYELDEDAALEADSVLLEAEATAMPSDDEPAE